MIYHTNPGNCHTDKIAGPVPAKPGLGRLLEARPLVRLGSLFVGSFLNPPGDV